MTLSDYYAYYDDIVSDWLEETLIPYEPFMPEPWWGWTPDSGHQLHAVVINLNPGEGGYPQSRQYIRSRLGNLFSYRRAMSDRLLARILPQTAAWHKRKRETPLSGMLRDISADSDSFSANTLCIEAYPLHSAFFNDAKAKQYFEQDEEHHFWYMMRFAALAAEKSIFRNTVFIRISNHRWLGLIEKFKHKFDYGEAATYKTDGAEAAVYRVKSGGKELLCDTSFMCIWNPKGRNDIPANLLQLLHQIDNPLFEQILKHQQINKTT